MSPRRFGVLAVLVTAGLSAVVAATADPGTAAGPRSGPCEPELDPAWGVEARLLRIPIVCGTGHLPEGDELALIDGPPGAELVAGAGEIAWTPGLDQAATYELVVRVGHEEATVTVGIGDAWNDPDNVGPLEPARLTHESGLPVLHLTTDPSVGPDGYTRAEVTYLGRRYAGASAKLRGSLSLQYEKDNYTIRFADDDRFSDPSLPDLDGSARLVLNGDFDDASHLRNRLAFELWNQMNPAHLQVAHASVVVYVNGEYGGLYTVTDQIGVEYLSEAGHRGGELYKTVSHAADFTASNDTLERRGLEQKVPDPDETVIADPAITDLFDFVDRASPATFTAELRDQIVLDDFVDWFVLVGLIGASDTTAKNAYLYFPDDGSAARALPWDFNHSFGQDFLTRRVDAGSSMPSELAGDNRLFERLLADPELASLVAIRFGEVLGGVGSTDAVEALVDRLRADIGGAAERDDERWGPVQRNTVAFAERTDFTSPDQEIDRVVTWYTERVDLLMTELDAISTP